MYEINEEFLEGETQQYAGEAEFEFEVDERDSGEDREIELAAELLSVSNDQELDQFLGRFLKRVGNTARGIINTPAGQQLKGLLRNTAKKAIPLAGRAIGGYIGGYIGGNRGADVGGHLGNAASRIFNLELEGMSPEDRELEVARRFIRLAGDAAQRVLNAPQSGNPRQIATSALAAAARTHAPGLFPGGARVIDHRRAQPPRPRRHDYRSRQTNEGETTVHDLDRTLRYEESELDGLELDGSFETEIYDQNEYASGPLSEEQEIELASEMLSVADEAELDQFLGKLLRRAGRAVAPLAKYIKPLAKKALPIVGRVAGSFFGGPAGGAIGSKLGSFASTLFEVDMESYETGEQEMEVARRMVRLGAAAAENAAAAPSNANPAVVARTALAQAARVHAPGLVKSSGSGSAATSRGGAAQSGRWVRRGNRIVILGA